MMVKTTSIHIDDISPAAWGCTVRMVSDTIMLSNGTWHYQVESSLLEWGELSIHS